MEQNRDAPIILSVLGALMSVVVIGAVIGLVGAVMGHRDRTRGRGDWDTSVAIVVGWVAVALGSAMAVLLVRQPGGIAFAPFPSP